MQKYYKITKYLEKIKYVTTILLLLYFVFLATQSVTYLINGSDICEVINCTNISKDSIVGNILPTYLMMMLFILVIFVCSMLKGSLTSKKVKIYVEYLIIALPTIYLIGFNFEYISNFMTCFIVVMLYILLVHSINFINSRILNLYSLAVGEVKENKKEKGENKNARKR